MRVNTHVVCPACKARNQYLRHRGREHVCRRCGLPLPDSVVAVERFKQHLWRCQPGTGGLVAHPATAHQQSGLSLLLDYYGADGYGRYWLVAEQLRLQPGRRLPYTSHVLESLARRCKCSPANLRAWLEHCQVWGLYAVYSVQGVDFFSAPEDKPSQGGQEA